MWGHWKVWRNEMMWTKCSCKYLLKYSENLSDLLISLWSVCLQGCTHQCVKLISAQTPPTSCGWTGKGATLVPASSCCLVMDKMHGEGKVKTKITQLDFTVYYLILYTFMSFTSHAIFIHSPQFSEAQDKLQRLKVLWDKWLPGTLEIGTNFTEQLLATSSNQLLIIPENTFFLINQWLPRGH